MKSNSRGHLMDGRYVSGTERSNDGVDAQRRAFLTQTAGIAAATAVAWPAPAAAAQAADASPVWMRVPGASMRGYGQPSKHEGKVLRAVVPNFGELAPGTGTARTPLQLLEGTITPNGLHFERHHNGVPDIDPAQHKLLIHGLVRKPIEFSIEALLRYPMVSRTCFIECAGNSGLNTLPRPPQ